jgi:TPR repeat protein
MNGSGGVQQDTREAMIEFQKAAEKGNAEAQYMLGQIYEDGGMGMAVPDSDGSYTNGRVVNFHPVPNDFGLAAKWYRMAAKQGNALAQNHLGLIYADGRAVPQDYAEAYFWLSLASANGSHSSTNGVDDRDLAASHLTKTALLQTQERARKWFEDHPGRPNPFK